MTPFRPLWQGIFGSALNPPHVMAFWANRLPTFVPVERRIRTAGDRKPAITQKARPSRCVGMLLYVAYLMTLLFWISDRSPGYKTTYQLMDFTRDTLGLIRGALVLPPVAKGMMRLAGIVEQVFGG